ncbi:MAG: phosphoribosylformylglycinamidine synthase subunit PurS [Nitrospirota bacterium]|nr:phosphoribosylformylglycinamidine synthase subunit PurS [Nitrospirota bacterium]
MKAKVFVTLKRGVLDPQGKAVLHSLHDMGYGEVGDVRMGKMIELSLDGTDRAKAEGRLKEMCEKLLANTVIESYRFEIEG